VTVSQKVFLSKLFIHSCFCHSTYRHSQLSLSVSTTLIIRLPEKIRSFSQYGNLNCVLTLTFLGPYFFLRNLFQDFAIFATIIASYSHIKHLLFTFIMLSVLESRCDVIFLKLIATNISRICFAYIIMKYPIASYNCSSHKQRPTFRYFLNVSRMILLPALISCVIFVFSFVCIYL
jgi:hypothetical protein